MSDRPFDVAVNEGIPVTLPSGATFFVLTSDEEHYLAERVRRYMGENRFINISDHQDIDKMVVFEMFVHRWSLWLSRGMDYYGEEVDSKQLAERISSYSTELRLLKKNLGIDKVTRDRQRGDDSVAAYLDGLKQRAREFGVMRNEQFAKVIELFMQLQALIQVHDNSDEIERKEQAVTQDDIFEWIRDFAIPEFQRIDADFRETEQKLWIRKM
jgi:hypothetical protein